MHRAEQKIVDKYGDLVNIYPPPIARKMINQQITTFVDVEVPPEGSRAQPLYKDICQMRVETDDIMIITGWSVYVLAFVDQTLWTPGRTTKQLEPYEMLGRVWFKPVEASASAIDETYANLDNNTFVHTPPGSNHGNVNLSVLRPYGTRWGDAPIEVLGGRQFALRVYFGDPRNGATPPPAPEDLRVFGQISGYFVNHHIDGQSEFKRIYGTPINGSVKRTSIDPATDQFRPQREKPDPIPGPFGKNFEDDDDHFFTEDDMADLDDY